MSDGIKDLNHRCGSEELVESSSGTENNLKKYVSHFPFQMHVPPDYFMQNSLFPLFLATLIKHTTQTTVQALEITHATTTQDIFLKLFGTKVAFRNQFLSVKCP